MTAIDHAATLLALRAPLLTLSVVTTGSTTLTATSTGYTRSSGSFVTDGFLVGMEVAPFGFTETTPVRVASVSASALGIVGGRTAQASGSGRSLTVGIPSRRAWENVLTSRVAGEWFLEEDFAPATRVLRGNVANGVVEETGLYVLRLFGPLGIGGAAFHVIADAVLAEYPPGAAIVSGLRVRGDVSPIRGQLTRVTEWSVLTLTIPWRAVS